MQIYFNFCDDKFNIVLNEPSYTDKKFGTALIFILIIERTYIILKKNTLYVMSYRYENFLIIRFVSYSPSTE